MAKVKVYLYFLKNEPSNVYAYTTDKGMSKRFEDERDMNLFVKKKVRMDKYECMAFQSKNNFAKLQQDVLNDGKDDFPILMTIYESTALDESCTYIMSTSDLIYSRLGSYPLKDKYLKIIKEITSNIIMNEDDKQPTLRVLNINTFKLFCYLFNQSIKETKELDNEFGI